MIKVENMKDSEAVEVKDLIIKVFDERVASVYTKEGVDRFYSMLTSDILVDMNNESDSFVITAKDDDKLVGMLGMIKMNHIGLIFVDTTCQKSGIGKQLINSAIHILKERNPYLREITVSSSPNSLSFYKNVGFQPTGDEVDEEGMRYTPMTMDVR